MNEKFFRINHPKTPEQRTTAEAAKAAAEKEAVIKAGEEAAAAAAAEAALAPLFSTPQRERGAAPEAARSTPGVRMSPATSRGEHPPRTPTLFVLRPCSWSPNNLLFDSEVIYIFFFRG